MQDPRDEIHLKEADGQSNTEPMESASSGESTVSLLALSPISTIDDHTDDVSLLIQVLVPPITYVPPEILSIVFTAHVLENNQSPWLLMQVSRAWRAAALMTRAIWARILLAPSNWTKLRKGVRSLDGMEVCSTERQLIPALRRASGSPLDLNIVFLPKIRRHPHWKAGYDMGLLECIARQQKKPRLHHLTVAIEDYIPVPAQAFDKFEFAELVSLTLNESSSDLIKKVVRETQGLHRLFITACDVEKMGQYQKWEKLVELGIRNLQHNDEIRSILSATTALTSLSLGGLLLNNRAERIHVPSLKQLGLRDFMGYWPVESPSLTHLTLHVLLMDSKTTPGSIHLPCLLDFSYDASPSLYATFGSEEAFRAFKVPSLRKLNFRCGHGADSERDLRCLWPRGLPSLAGEKKPLSNIDPPILLFCGTGIHPMVLARTVVGRASLQELFLVTVEVTTGFLDHLQPVRIGEWLTRSQAAQQEVESEWKILCRALKRLSIDLVGCKIKQEREEVEASAIKLVVARSKVGVPFERFSMRFSEEDGWIELA